MKTPSQHDVEVCIQALEIEDDDEKQALRAFWAREREQNRKANRKLLAGIGRVLAKSFVFLMLIWALLIALGVL